MKKILRSKLSIRRLFHCSETGTLSPVSYAVIWQNGGMATEKQVNYVSVMAAARKFRIPDSVDLAGAPHSVISDWIRVLMLGVNPFAPGYVKPARMGILPAQVDEIQLLQLLHGFPHSSDLALSYMGYKRAIEWISMLNDGINPKVGQKKTSQVPKTERRIVRFE